jgi:hypothetical protein
MTTYYLYRLTNSLKFDKCGASSDFNKRCLDNREQHGAQCIITVIETMEGPNTPEMWQIVGDREWELADQYGYPRGVHYRITRESRQPWNDQTRYVLTPEDGRKGGSISGLLKPSKETKLKMGLAKAKLRNDANTIRERFKQWESSKYKFELIIAEEYNVSRSTINRILRKHIY